MLIKRQHTRRREGRGGKREKFKHNLYDLPMRQSRRGVPKMLFMARSMAREGRCCQLDCPRADGLFTPDFGLLLYVVCPSQLGWIDCPVAHIDEIVWGTTPGAKGRRRREGDGSEWRQQSQWNFFWSGGADWDWECRRQQGLALADCGYGYGCVAVAAVLSSKTINSARGFLSPARYIF